MLDEGCRLAFFSCLTKVSYFFFCRISLHSGHEVDPLRQTPQNEWKQPYKRFQFSSWLEMLPRVKSHSFVWSVLLSQRYPRGKQQSSYICWDTLLAVWHELEHLCCICCLRRIDFVLDSERLLETWRTVLEHILLLTREVDCARKKTAQVWWQMTCSGTGYPLTGKCTFPLS